MKCYTEQIYRRLWLGSHRRVGQGIADHIGISIQETIEDRAAIADQLKAYLVDHRQTGDQVSTGMHSPPGRHETRETQETGKT